MTDKLIGAVLSAIFCIAFFTVFNIWFDNPAVKKELQGESLEKAIERTMKVGERNEEWKTLDACQRYNVLAEPSGLSLKSCGN